MDPIKKNRFFNKKPLLIIASVFIIVLILGTFRYYQYEKNRIVSEKYKELNTVTRLKVDELSGWYKERLAEAEFFPVQSYFVLNVERLLKETEKKEIQEYFFHTLNPAKTNHKYNDIFLAAPDGKILFSFNSNSKPSKWEKIPESKSLEISVNDFYLAEESKIYFEINSPIVSQNKVIAFLVFRIEPHEYLYSLVRSWPVYSKTAEGILVRKENDGVQILNDLRFKKNSALKLKIPFTQQRAVCIKAAQGKQGIVEGTDYREIQVLAEIRQIPGTPWILINKIDISEVYSEVKDKVILLLVIITAFILFFITGIILYYEHYKKKLYFEMILQERDLEETTGEFRTTLYSIGDGVITTDIKGHVRHMNYVAEKLTGWQEKDAEGLPITRVFRLINENSLEPIELIINNILSKKEYEPSFFKKPVILISKSGTQIPVSNSGSPIKDEHGAITGVVIVFKDQTDSREAEKLLRESEERYRSLFNNKHTVMLLLDPENGNIIDANPAACIFYGHTRHEITKLKIYNINQLRPEEVRQKMQEVKLSGGKKFQFRHKLSNGEIRDVEVYSEPVSLHGKPYLYSIIHDITHRKISEEALKASEVKFSTAFRTSPDSININRIPDGLYVEINEGFTKLTGYQPEEVIGKTSKEIGIWVDYEKRNQLVAVVLSDGIVNDFESKFRMKDGSIRTGLVSARKLVIDGEDHILSITHDISDRKNAERALEESEKRLRLFVEHAPAAIAMLDKDMRYIAVSKRWLSDYNLKHDNIIGCSHYDIFPEMPERWKEIHKSCLSGNIEKCEEDIFPRMDGSLDWLRWEIHPWYEEQDKIGGVIIFSELINVRKQAEKNFLEKIKLEEQISRIAVTAPGALYSLKLHPTGKVSFPYVSPMFEDFFNIKQADAVDDGSVVFEKIFSDDSELVKQTIKQSAATLTDWLCEFRILHPEKGILWVESHSNPSPQEDGSILWHGFISDITHKKVAEQALHESQEHLKLVVESSNDIFIMQDTDGKYLHCSGSKKYGLEPSNLIGKYPEEIYPPHRAVKVRKRIKKVVETGRTLIEEELVDLNGEGLWFNTQVTPVFDEKNKVIAVTTIARNITKQRLADENIRKLSRGIEQSPAIILITNKNGNIEYVNPKFTQVTGYTFEEVKGKNPRFLKSGVMPAEQYQDLWSTILAKKEWHGEFLNKKKNGELYWESASISPLLNEDGEIINFIAVKEDITALKKMTNELIQAKEKAVEMNRIKSYFFANISHELRTPFVGILGFSELLSEILEDPEQKKMAESILSSSKRLTDTLNKILDLSKLEFDKMEMHFSNIDVSALVESVKLLYSKSADGQNTSITAHYSSMPLFWESDEKLLRGIVSNLLNNAIKFTSNGKIDIRVSISGEGVEQQLVISVSDTGVGIPKDKHEIIWQEFRQVSEGYNRTFEGTGLGLTITKKYVELLEGKVYLESEPGKGSVFTIKLPKIENLKTEKVQTGTVNEKTLPYKSKKEHKLILYIEDDFISAEFVKEVLGKKYKLSLANKPGKALEMIKSKNYAAVLLDINLGYGMNGIELLKEIKQVENYKDVPIIAVTAYASTTDQDEFISQGFSYYISKPFLAKDLLSLLEDIFKTS